MLLNVKCVEDSTNLSHQKNHSWKSLCIVLCVPICCWYHPLRDLEVH